MEDLNPQPPKVKEGQEQQDHQSEQTHEKALPGGTETVEDFSSGKITIERHVRKDQSGEYHHGSSLSRADIVVIGDRGQPQLDCRNPYGRQPIEPQSTRAVDSENPKVNRETFLPAEQTVVDASQYEELKARQLTLAEVGDKAKEGDKPPAPVLPPEAPTVTKDAQGHVTGIEYHDKDGKPTGTSKHFEYDKDGHMTGYTADNGSHWKCDPKNPNHWQQVGPNGETVDPKTNQPYKGTLDGIMAPQADGSFSFINFRDGKAPDGKEEHSHITYYKSDGTKVEDPPEGMPGGAELLNNAFDELKRHRNFLSGTLEDLNPLDPNVTMNELELGATVHDGNASPQARFAAALLKSYMAEHKLDHVDIPKDETQRKAFFDQIARDPKVVKRALQEFKAPTSETKAPETKSTVPPPPETKPQG